MQITILVGTMSGTAEMVAEEMGEALAGAGHDVNMQILDDGSDVDIFDREGLFVLCTSTYGSGNIPDNVIALSERLDEKKPDLSAVRHGVFALGDHTYQDTFCHGAEFLDRQLSGLGAKRLGDIRYNDASGTELPEDVGPEWVLEWLDKHAGTSSGTT